MFEGPAVPRPHYASLFQVISSLDQHHLLIERGLVQRVQTLIRIGGEPSRRRTAFRGSSGRIGLAF